MRVFVAVILGLLGGVLIYFELAMIFPSIIQKGGLNSTVFVLITLVGGWALCSYMMVKGANSVSKVFSRGFLMVGYGRILWI